MRECLLRFGLAALHGVAFVREKGSLESQTWRTQLCRPPPRPRSSWRGLCFVRVVLTRPAAGPSTGQDSHHLSLGMQARATAWGLRGAVPVPHKRSVRWLK